MAYLGLLLAGIGVAVIVGAITVFVREIRKDQALRVFYRQQEISERNQHIIDLNNILLQAGEILQRAPNREISKASSFEFKDDLCRASEPENIGELFGGTINDAFRSAGMQELFPVYKSEISPRWSTDDRMRVAERIARISRTAIHEFGDDFLVRDQVAHRLVVIVWVLTMSAEYLEANRRNVLEAAGMWKDGNEG